MPHLPVSEIIVIVCMAVFTAVAAVIDLRTRRIPNKLTVPVFLAGIVFQIGCMIFANRFGSVWLAIADLLKAFAVGFGVLFVLWMIGGGGGGDVKLMGALSVWLGFDRTLAVLAMSTAVVLFGTLAIMVIKIARRGLERARSQLANQGQAGSAGKAPQRRIMTYAFPVAIATWLVLFWFSFVKPQLAERHHNAAGSRPDAVAGQNS